jgi:hypothetical protein
MTRLSGFREQAKGLGRIPGAGTRIAGSVNAEVAKRILAEVAFSVRPAYLTNVFLALTPEVARVRVG